jgi:hypothetical protein
MKCAITHISGPHGMTFQAAEFESAPPHSARGARTPPEVRNFAAGATVKPFHHPTDNDVSSNPYTKDIFGDPKPGISDLKLEIVHPRATSRIYELNTNHTSDNVQLLAAFRAVSALRCFITSYDRLADILRLDLLSFVVQM